MGKRLTLIAVGLCVTADIAYAQYPILDMVADRVEPARGLDDHRQERRNLLPERQHVVHRVVRRKWRFLQGSAGALRRWRDIPAPRIIPARLLGEN